MKLPLRYRIFHISRDWGKVRRFVFFMRLHLRSAVPEHFSYHSSPPERIPRQRMGLFWLDTSQSGSAAAGGLLRRVV